MGMMREEGTTIGRFKVSRLMEELGLICKQPGSHAYKQATVERIDIPNHLNRQFEVDAPNQVWCGDITYVWAQGRWHYLAVVLDLFTRRVVGWAFSTRPDADLVVRALEMTYEQRGRPHLRISQCRTDVQPKLLRCLGAWIQFLGGLKLLLLQTLDLWAGRSFGWRNALG